MGKRKSPSKENDSADQSPYTQFIKMSWEKTGKKGNYDAFVKTCEVKWAEMTDNEKILYAERLSEENKNGPSEDKKKKEEKNPTGRARSKKKTPKDPNAKKRPLGPYLIFCNEVRESVKLSNPDLAPKEITRELGQRWKALSDDEKKKYQTLASIAKEKYVNELQEEKDKTMKNSLED